MSVTGIALILFLTFHCCMNVVALFSGEAYNMICELLGANWYAVAATLGLAALAAFHIVYAFILTMQHRRQQEHHREDQAQQEHDAPGEVAFFPHPSTSFPNQSSTLNSSAIRITMTMAMITAAAESFW